MIGRDEAISAAAAAVEAAAASPPRPRHKLRAVRSVSARDVNNSFSLTAASPSSHRPSNVRSMSARNFVVVNSQSVNSANGRAQAAFIRSNNEVGPMSQEERMKVTAKSMIRKIFRRDIHREDDGSLRDLSNFDRRSFHSGRSNNSNSARAFLSRVGFGFGGGNNNDDGDDDDSAIGPPGFNDDDNENNMPSPPPPNPQYRLEAMHNYYDGGRHCCSKVLSLCGTNGRDTAIGIHNNKRLVRSLHWMFRVNFVILFGVMCSMFFTLVLIFAGFIFAAGKMDSQCVRAGGVPFDQLQSQFADSFALSWTTFSTVGYGSTYPAVGHENDNPTNCLFINFVCSLEAFFGVLYSGFCGAILFGKVLRIQSHAQVIFSDPIVIRYGSGVQGGDSDSIDNDEEALPRHLPCPVLEFRVINRLFAEAGGEIMDATMTVVANIDADDEDPGLGDEPDTVQRRSGHKHKQENAKNLAGSFLRSRANSQTDSRSGSRGGGTHNTNNNSRIMNSESAPTDAMSDRRSDLGDASVDSKATGATRNTLFFDTILRRHHHAVDEDPPAGRFVKKRIFTKIWTEAPEHPFFKRVWLGRHILDENSPILKEKVRRQIHRNGGFWPERLNNYTAVRESLHFNQILVSLNGVSNVSACDVYSQKIYDFVDINVGYQFVNVLYKDESNGTLKVDTDLINDVREQNGGGGEPLILDE